MAGIAKCHVFALGGRQLGDPKWDQNLFEMYRFTIVKRHIWL